ncbi:MAG: FAD-binding protein [Gammaproteobacteria bacterium]|nr:FAD-binding protein [Gammaproteobacteria bacterium]MCP5137254.1 FAD-binding protein [Gammaproteobacteria bacterium]
MPAFGKVDAAVLSQLREVFDAEDLLTDPGECATYGYDNSRRRAVPDAVVFPRREDQVSALALLCSQRRIPLVARGRGTGTTGATVPTDAGVVISFERMRRILSIDPANRLMIVEPGVTNAEVQVAAAEHGFFWPPDPTSAAVCTIGGNLAYNSAGPRAVKYGTPRDNTLGLRVVTGDGRRLKTGVSTTKGVVGYDLTRLIIGSEGTLALITEATLKLTPLPQAKLGLRAIYRDMHAAANAVARIMAQPVTPCALEFIDAHALDLVRRRGADIETEAGGMLMIEVDGPASCIADAADAVAAAAQVDGALEVRIAHDTDELARLWAARKALSPALRGIAPKKINEDVVVPVSHIPTLIDGLDHLSDEFGIPIVNFGHAGNGNIHVNLLYDAANAVHAANADACLDRVFELVLELDGTISGEHGIGLVKRDFVAREIAPVALDLMRAIKAQFDPAGILNPGKAIPEID